MEKLSELFKSDLSVVDAVGVYNCATSGYAYSDKDLEIDLVRSFERSKCFKSMDQLYMIVRGNNFYLQVQDQFIAVIRLKKGRDVNKPILKLKTREFLQNLKSS